MMSMIESPAFSKYLAFDSMKSKMTMSFGNGLFVAQRLY